MTTTSPSPENNDDQPAHRRKAKKPQDRFLGRLVTKSPLPQKVKDVLNTDVSDFFKKTK